MNEGIDRLDNKNAFLLSIPRNKYKQPRRWTNVFSSFYAKYVFFFRLKIIFNKTTTNDILLSICRCTYMLL